MKKFKLKIKINKKWEIITTRSLDIKNITHSIRLNLSKKFKMTLGELLTSDDYNLKIEICGICNKRLSFFTPNIKINDNNEIIIESVNYPNNYYCKELDCKNKFNPNSIEFVSMVNRIDETTALKKIHNRNSSPFYVENHISKDDYIKYQTRNEKWFYENYGENYIDYYNEYHDKLKYSHTLEYNIEKYGYEKGKEIFNYKCCSKDSMSLNYALKKFNGDLEKAKIYCFHRLIQTRPVFSNFYSKESIIFFEKLLKLVNLSSNDVYYKENEYKIFDDGKIFYYDFTIKNSNKIIEYNGTNFHVNIDKLSKEELNKWKQPITNECWQNVYEKDLLKKKAANKCGFDILYVWNDDDVKINLDKSVNFLNKK